MQRATHCIPGLILVDHTFDVPLDHDAPAGDTIEIFAREVRPVGDDNPARPWLVFLQGGPGFPSPRPVDRSGWLDRALRDFRVLFLDQRGTGRSSAVSARSLTRLGDAESQAAYLRLFRADSIVRDAELIRHEIAAGETWTVLGQSYGGFCVAHYLSAAPDGLAAALITGGLPPLTRSCDDIYRRTYRVCARKNRLYYERYPGDVDRIRRIAGRLGASDVVLPCGDRMSVRRFQQLGLLLGMSDGFEALHYLVEDAFVPATDELSHGFLRGFENALRFDTNPIFSILHEACYAQGFATDWSAERVRAEFPEFEPSGDDPIYLTGEMIYPWMFEEIGQLRPLAAAAQLLAARSDWPHLYDLERLAENEVPAAAVCYADDMYVERELSEATAAAIRGLRLWLTNEYEHNGLRAAGGRVVGRLLDMVHGRV